MISSLIPADITTAGPNGPSTWPSVGPIRLCRGQAGFVLVTEQIAGWLRRRFPGDASMQISHEAIYLSLYDPRRRQAIDRGLTQRLRSARSMRRPKIARRPTGRGIIRWEGDLVMGTRPSAVVTFVERTSRYTAIAALPDGIKAEQVTPPGGSEFDSVPKFRPSSAGCRR
ncbi:hypothetical protein [Streptomyces sp. 8K308]|uniref:hypothetical protein n=1 Tax=Streptomyces sp. 8K308 TaxID=2530388 RepID=UPI001FB71DEE|nr:hypothetical protein [Streptomyces sp. 8K308]